MKRIVTFGEFFSTLGLGLWQAVCYVCRAFDPRHKTKFWRVIWAIWTFALLLVIAVAGCALYRELYDPYSYRDSKEWISNDVYCLRHGNGDCDIVNAKSGKKCLRDIAYCCRPSDGDTLAVFFMEGKRGYFSINTGEVVLPAIYEKAWRFSDGVAMVVREGRLHLIDGTGESLSTFAFSRLAHYDGEGEAISYVFHDGRCIVNTIEGKWGLIDTRGNWVLPAEYNSLCRIEYGAGAIYRLSADDLENGGSLYGLVDREGRVLIPCIYKTLKVDDTEGIFVTDSQHNQWQADLQGNLSDQPLCYNVTHLEYTVKLSAGRSGEAGDDYEDCTQASRFAPLYSYTSSSEGYMGLMDANGHRITPPLYRSIKAINDNLYCCGYDDNFDNAVLLDAKGAVAK